MKAIVVGMGVQGKKRKKFLGNDFVFSVDKFKKADFRLINQVPLKKFDTAFLCVPDNQKIKIIKYCLINKKNILVEKPLLAKKNNEIKNLEKLAIKNKVVLYSAYNHRFEPAIKKIRKLILNKKLGKIYNCRFFYGNGTSYLVNKSKWRDKGLGVITDIGSHLIDLCIFLFGKKIKNLKIIKINKFENRAPDHALLGLEINGVSIELEMTLCMWKNNFTCDILASKGSVHLNSLSKWEKNTFIYRKRKLPSGKPIEKKTFFKKGDPTWQAENIHFKNLIKKNARTNLKKDILINDKFLKLKKNTSL